MIATIYARKSTEQNGADADAKSAARQCASERKARHVAEGHKEGLPQNRIVGDRG